MTDFFPELKQRYFVSSFARRWCDRIYGGAIADSTWGRWRRWAGIPTDAKILRFDQICFLAAVATIRADDRARGRSLRRELHLQNEILPLMESLEIQEPLAKVIQYMDATGTVSGKDAAAALRARGYQVTERSLYRSVPKFNRQRLYQVEYLERFVG